MNEFYCPLVGFKLNWKVNFENNKLDIIKDITIISKNDLPELSILSDCLTREVISQYENQVYYWLYLKNDYDEIEEIINIFQLVLWIIRPTEYHINFISNLTKDNKKRIYRYLLSRFIPIHNHFEYEYNNNDIEKLKKFLPTMIDLYKKNRFKNSIVFNYHGCITNFWEAAYIQFSATFESLLNHKSYISKQLINELKWGVKKKLAWAYAILTEANNEKRPLAFDNFRDIYKIRSEILHGESFKEKYNDGNINLHKLAKCRDMLRKLWRVILDSDEIIEILSGSDNVRRDYFKKVANGWMPEEEKGKK